MDNTINDIVIPEGYAYDCENAEYLYYRNPYTGKEIMVPKTKDIIIVVPQGATNGDMIKAMFNCMVIEISKGKVYVEGIYFPFDEEWWNAPYKAESEE